MYINFLRCQTAKNQIILDWVSKPYDGQLTANHYQEIWTHMAGWSLTLSTRITNFAEALVLGAAIPLQIGVKGFDQ
jgi:hypothetical protein